jgi:hypothetical protein
MSYPYPHRTRAQRREVRSASFEVAAGTGTTTHVLNLPAGAFAMGITVETVANGGTVVANVTPFVDDAQTITAGKFKFLSTGATTASTNITLAATSTKRGYHGVIIPAGDQYGAAAPILAIHGMKIEVTAASSVGTAEVHYTAVEL